MFIAVSEIILFLLAGVIGIELTCGSFTLFRKYREIRVKKKKKVCRCPSKKLVQPKGSEHSRTGTYSISNTYRFCEKRFEKQYNCRVKPNRKEDLNGKQKLKDKRRKIKRNKKVENDRCEK